jgi:hypothetical protein
MRTATMSSKILWLLPPGYVLPNDGPNGETRLVVTGRRLGTPVRRFKQVFLGGKGSTDVGERYFFPSNINPPTVGCWRLTFQGRDGQRLGDHARAAAASRLAAGCGAGFRAGVLAHAGAAGAPRARRHR